MMFAVRERFDHIRACACLSVRIGAALLIAALAAGCHGQLAQNHDFFAPGGATGTLSQTETQRVLAYYQALQAAQRGCPGGRPASAIPDDTSWNPAEADRQAAPQQPWAHSCPGADSSHAAHGGASNSYRRWVEDKVRELPAPSETASSIGSGS